MGEVKDCRNLHGKQFNKFFFLDISLWTILDYPTFPSLRLQHQLGKKYDNVTVCIPRPYFFILLLSVIPYAQHSGLSVIIDIDSRGKVWLKVVTA